MKDIQDLKIFDWYERKVQQINDSNKAGFVHDDACLTNPIKIEISPSTLEKLEINRNKRLRKNGK